MTCQWHFWKKRYWHTWNWKDFVDMTLLSWSCLISMWISGSCMGNLLTFVYACCNARLMFAKLLCCLLFVLMWEEKNHLHHAKHQPATSWSLQGSDSNASQKMGHHHALDDIHTSWGSVISRQIPPEVNGVWSVCVGVQIWTSDLAGVWMSRDEVNMHKKWHFNSKLSEVTKNWHLFCIFAVKTKVG